MVLSVVLSYKIVSLWYVSFSPLSLTATSAAYITPVPIVSIVAAITAATDAAFIRLEPV